jgi:Icc-related predicted phosphoesterase
MAKRMRIFYSADIHGSEVCFRKWINAAQTYKADVVIFGGDLTGKILHPIEHMDGRYVTELYGERIEAQTDEELNHVKSRLRNAGRYVTVVTREEKAALDASPELVHDAFLRVARATAERWIQLADERLGRTGIPAYMILGNDDFNEIEDVFREADWVVNPEERIQELPGGFEMISLGYSNPTPWNSPRELEESSLSDSLEKMARNLRDPRASIFNVHVPPQDTHLDRAPLLDDNFRPIVRGGQILTGSVGSAAVRSLVQEYQPLLGLHGHIHESPGMSKIGGTVVLNPGSEYVDGILRGAIVTLDRAKGVRGWQFIQG